MKTKISPIFATKYGSNVRGLMYINIDLFDIYDKVHTHFKEERYDINVKRDLYTLN